MLTDPFSEEFISNDTRIELDGNSSPHSPYIMMTDFALASGANVNLDYVKRSFDSFNPFSNELSAQYTNDFCLMCINAFDLSNNIELLYLAEHIYSSYKQVNLDKNVVYINRLQINLRVNGFITDDDIKKLIKIKQSQIENIELQFCTSVLLESKHESKMHFLKLSKEKQKYYEKLPIYKLYSKILVA